MIPRDETSPPASKSKRASTRSILHVDMDAFFASVEALDDPSLLGKPVVVGMPPEERGVVAAASYEARRYGVHSAMSMHQALKLCPQAIVVRPRGRRYREISRQIFDIFRHYTPLVEPVSIDEAFLDVTASRRLFGTPEQIGHEIKRRIRDEIGLTASVGIAPNKYLAKLASDLKKPDGFVVIAENQIEEILAGLPVGKLWGVGPKSEAALARLGIHLVRDLLAYPAETLARHLGDSAWELLALARGIDDRPVVTEGETKSISAETTFARDLRDSEALTKELDGLADEVAQRLRREGFRARTMTLKARYPDFTTVTRSVTLPSPTASTVAVRRVARELLHHRLGRMGRPLRLLGVAATNLERVDEGQLDLFHDGKEAQGEKLDSLMDRIQARFGADKIRRGGA